ncbi:hypothetical protein Pd630_LPD10119 (plasmid) [Rhodococcus opacus PD630]|nr:hypothetical protein Pd630_LPD10119 [Rhodococcus opacus PD630]
MPPRPRSLESDLEDVSPIAPRPTPPPAKKQEDVYKRQSKKMGFYSTEDERIRAAYLNTRGREPGETFGEFMENAVLERVARLEKKYNDGREWEGVDAGTIKSITQLGVGRNRPR